MAFPACMTGLSLGLLLLTPWAIVVVLLLATATVMIGGQWGPWRRGRGYSEAEARELVADVRSGAFSINAVLPEVARPAAYGALGEQRVGKILNSLGPGWEVAHDVWLGRAPRPIRANADHLVSGPSTGLIMVDTKCWRGEVFRDGKTLGARGSGLNATEIALRSKAPGTLAAEAASVSSAGSAVVLIVVAITGSGTVANGVVELDGYRGRPPIVVVRAETLTELLHSRSQPGRTLVVGDILTRLREA